MEEACVQWMAKYYWALDCYQKSSVVTVKNVTNKVINYVASLFDIFESKVRSDPWAYDSVNKQPLSQFLLPTFYFTVFT